MRELSKRKSIFFSFNDGGEKVTSICWVVAALAFVVVFHIAAIPERTSWRSIPSIMLLVYAVSNIGSAIIVLCMEFRMSRSGFALGAILIFL